MKVAVWAPASHTQLVPILSALPGVEIVPVQSRTDLAAACRDGLDVLVAGGSAYDAEAAALLRQVPSFRLLHFLSAGYDGVLRCGIADEVTICNAGSAWSPAVAEHAMALLLALARQLPAAGLLQREHRWEKRLGLQLRSLDGMTLAVLGLGSIGKEIAKRARGFGMQVLGVSRSGRTDASADEVHPATAMHAVLARADAVVIATPFTPETQHLMNDAAFAALKPGALIVNISRGGTLDQDALLRALDAGVVAGAGLDVTEPEPLPAGHPLWNRPEVIITPHVAGLGSARARLRLAELVRDNIDAFRRGGALQNCIRDRRTERSER